MEGIDVSRQGHRPRHLSLNVFSFLRRTTLDFIDAYLRNVEAELRVGMWDWS
jgi:hypothetical protein